MAELYSEAQENGQRRSGHLSPGRQRLKGKTNLHASSRLLHTQEKQSEEAESDEDEQGTKMGPGCCAQFFEDMVSCRFCGNLEAL